MYIAEHDFNNVIDAYSTIPSVTNQNINNLMADFMVVIDKLVVINRT